MKLERLTEEVKRAVDIAAGDLETHLGEWIPWDDEHGENKVESGPDVPEGMHLSVIMDVDDPEVKEGQIILRLTGYFLLRSGE